MCMVWQACSKAGKKCTALMKSVISLVGWMRMGPCADRRPLVSEKSGSAEGFLGGTVGG